MKQILIVNHTEVFKGGSERSNVLLAHSLLKRNVEPILLYPSTSTIPNEEQRKFKLIKTPKHNQSTKKPSIHNYLKVIIRRIWYFYWLIKHRNKFNNIEKIICVTNRTCTEFVFFRFLLRKQTVYFNRGYDSNLMLKYLLFNFSNQIVTLNPERNLPYIYRKNVIKACNYLNWLEIKEPINRGQDIVSIGRASIEKGVDLFDNITRKLNKNTFRRYGHGCSVYAFFQNTSAFEFASQDTIYSNAWLYLSTSRSEDFPRVFLESIAKGLLIVAYRFNGIDRFVNDGITLWVADSEDEIISLIRKLQAFSPEKRNTIIKANFLRAKELYNDKYVDELL